MGAYERALEKQQRGEQLTERERRALDPSRPNEFAEGGAAVREYEQKQAQQKLSSDALALIASLKQQVAAQKGGGVSQQDVQEVADAPAPAPAPAPTPRPQGPQVRTPPPAVDTTGTVLDPAQQTPMTGAIADMAREQQKSRPTPQLHAPIDTLRGAAEYKANVPQRQPQAAPAPAPAPTPAPQPTPPAAAAQPAAKPGGPRGIDALASFSPRQALLNHPDYYRVAGTPEMQAYRADIEEQEQASQQQTADEALSKAIDALKQDSGLADSPIITLLDAARASPSNRKMLEGLVRELSTQTRQMTTGGAQREWQTGEREATQNWKTGEREASQEFKSEQDALDFGRDQALARLNAGLRDKGKAPGADGEKPKRPLSALTATQLGDTKSAVEQLDIMMSGAKGIPMQFGPTDKFRVLNPWDTSAQSFQQLVAATKQLIGKGLEGGVLRKEDEEKYEKIIPKLGDTRPVLQNKYTQLRSMLQLKYDSARESLNAADWDVSGFPDIEQPTVDMTDTSGTPAPRKITPPMAPTKKRKRWNPATNQFEEVQ